ncbi:hypothetical protein IG631_11248 [Alternaria alternata]|nr:hypothetical protein IG631_11248 [Alternaria alternata]
MAQGVEADSEQSVNIRNRTVEQIRESKINDAEYKPEIVIESGGRKTKVSRRRDGERQERCGVDHQAELANPSSLRLYRQPPDHMYRPIVNELKITFNIT